MLACEVGGRGTRWCRIKASKGMHGSIHGRLVSSIEAI